MKSFIISMILFACLIGFSIFHSCALDKITGNIIIKNNIIAENINDGDYPAAGAKSEELKKYIDSRRTVLSATLDHGVLNKIDEYIALTDGYITQKDKIDAFVSCKSLSAFLENLPKNYKLKIDNIL
ncbi:MAG: DUF4363 family protein [Oscillospiraceae bacterium]|nr:DUF4363 family protein [Oscillospiraceae bacterium]